MRQISIRMASGLAAGARLLSDGRLCAGPARADGGERLVLAFYYNWFDENSWTPSKVPDFPAQTYVSRDRAAMARHIDQAKAAGIDALVVNWCGPQEQQPDRDQPARHVGRGGGPRFPDCSGCGPEFAVLRSAGDDPGCDEHLAQRRMRNHSAYLKVERQTGGVFLPPESPVQHERLGADPERGRPGPRNSLWIEEGTWMCRRCRCLTATICIRCPGQIARTWAIRPTSSPSGCGRRLPHCGRSEGLCRHRHARLRRSQDWPRQRGFAVGREDGAYYARSWQAAIGSAPDWIVITSFNEWPEGTYIEPSQAYGNLFLDLTAQWSAAFRGSAPPPPPPTPKPKPKVAAPAKPKPTLVKPTSTPKPTPMPTRTPEPVFTVPGGLSAK